jgi:23S rRNA (pseudouridine1915-N3)-methyltransferase
VRIVAVGTIKERSTRALVDEYLGRIRRYCKVDEVELKAAAEAKLEQAIARATKDANVVALDVKGDSMTSKQLARRFERLAARGKGIVALLIGGADGLPRTVLAGADERWSLSALTLPHRLARVVVAEQLYRAMTILRSEPYDH